jgi:NitT/TauT family transport system substrate-binding protein
LLQGASPPRCVGPCCHAPARSQGPLQVGGLPVTCNLTLPVACVARERPTGGRRRERQVPLRVQQIQRLAEIKESLMTGRIQAAYMLAPLVMDLADKKIPVKIVSLGHRSGAVIMVRTESPYQHFKQLAGKRIAIPSRFAVDFLFLRKMLAQESMTPADVEIVEMAPPGHAGGALRQCRGRVLHRRAVRRRRTKRGYARPLRMTRDEWRNYICCVLTVREELIAENPALVQDLVDHCARRRRVARQQQGNRDKAVAIAAGRNFFNQDPKILQFVMENPTDRVTYGDLAHDPRRVRRA